MHLFRSATLLHLLAPPPPPPPHLPPSLAAAATRQEYKLLLEALAKDPATRGPNFVQPWLKSKVMA